MKKYFKYASLILGLLYFSTSGAYALVNGLCDNTTTFSCSVGTAVSKVSGSCGGNATWTCNGSGSGHTNDSCSKANPACVVNCVGSWNDTTNCNKFCGGGVKQQVYTITTQASGGGTDCTYNSGDTRWGTTSCNTQACTPPSLSATISPTTPLSGWYNSNPTITIYTSDTSGSGLNYSKYSWNTNTSTCRSSGTLYSNGTSIPLSTDGSNTLYICNKDNLNLTNSANYTYKLDKTSPIGNVSYSPSGWTNGSVAVNVACTDGLSGCPQSTYSTTVTSNGAGNITIYDKAGNSTVKSYSVSTIDVVKPIASASATVPVSGWYSPSYMPSITLNTSDSGGSGIKNSKYSWDTNDTTCRNSGTSYNDGKIISDIPLSDGDHILYLCNEDNAGNTGYNSYTYKLDITAPANPNVTCGEFINDDPNNYDGEDTCTLAYTQTNSPKNKVQYSKDNGSTWSDTTGSGTDLSFKITPPIGTTQIKMRIRDESLLWATSDTFTLKKKNGPYIPPNGFSFSPSGTVTAGTNGYIQLTFYDYLSSTYVTGDTTTDFKYTISGYDGTNFSENVSINNSSCSSNGSMCTYTGTTEGTLVMVKMVKSSSKRIKVVIKEPISANKAGNGTYSIILENSDRGTSYNETQTSPSITVIPNDNVGYGEVSVTGDNGNGYSATISSLKDIWGNSYSNGKSFNNISIIGASSVKFPGGGISKSVTLSSQKLTFGFEGIGLVRGFNVGGKEILLKDPIAINTIGNPNSSVDFVYSNSSVTFTTTCTNDDFSGCDSSKNISRTYYNESENNTNGNGSIEDMAGNVWSGWSYNMHHIDKTTPITKLSCYSSGILITTNNTTNKDLVKCNFGFENEDKIYYSPKSLHIEVQRKNTSGIFTTLTGYYSGNRFNRFYPPSNPDDNNYHSFFTAINDVLYFNYNYNGQTYYFYDNHSSDPSASGNKWAYKGDLLNEDFGTNGTYKVKLHGSDHAGNVSTVGSLVFKVDTTLPRIDTDLDENIWYTTNAPYTINGDNLKNFEFIIADQTGSTTDYEEAGLQNLVVKLNGVNINSKIKLGNLGTNFSLSDFRTNNTSEKKIILPKDYLKDMANNFDKVNTLTFEITDKVGHTRVKTYNLKIDRTTPNTPIISCKNWANSVDFPNGSWKNFGGANCSIAPDSTFGPSPITVEYSIKNNGVTNTYTGSWTDRTQPFSLSQYLAEGTNTLKVRIIDVAGISPNVSSETNAPNGIYVLKIDRTPPKIKWNCTGSKMIDGESTIDKYSSGTVNCSGVIDPVRTSGSDTSPETLQYIHSTSDGILSNIDPTNQKTNGNTIQTNGGYIDNGKYIITMSGSDEAGNIATYDVNGWTAKNMTFKIDTTDPKWISSPLNNGKNINSWYNSGSLQDISFTIKDQSGSTTSNEETGIKSIKVSINGTDRTTMFNGFTETIGVDGTTITIPGNSLKSLVGTSADKIKTGLNKFRFEITDKVGHTYTTPDSLPTTQRTVDTNKFDLTEGIAEHHDDTIPATPVITCVNGSTESLNWPSNERKNYHKTKCYIAPKVNTYGPSPVKILWSYTNNVTGPSVVYSGSVPWQGQGFATGTTSSGFIDFGTSLPELPEGINKIKFKVEDTAGTSTGVEYIVKKDTVAPGVGFNFSSFPKLADIGNVDIDDQRIFDNFGGVYSGGHILNKCSDSDCWLTGTMSIRGPTYTGSFTNIFDDKSFSGKYIGYGTGTFKFNDTEIYSLTGAGDYKIQFNLIDKAGNITSTGGIVHIYPNLADENKSTISTNTRDNKYADNSGTYDYVITLKDKFGNLIHNKKLMYLKQESRSSTGEIKTDMVTYLSGGLTTTQINLLTNALVEQGTGTIDETDGTGALGTMGQTHFTIKSLAPGKFVEKFEVKLYEWGSGYVNNTTLRNLYITGSTTNSFRKPFWGKLQISKTNGELPSTDPNYLTDWEGQPSIGTTRAYRLLIQTGTTLSGITLDDGSGGILSGKINPIGSNSIISLQGTKLVDNIIANLNTNSRNYVRFSTRINNSGSTAIDNSYYIGFSGGIITLPIVNYTLSGIYDIRYNLSSNFNGGDLSSISIGGERFLDPVIVGETQVGAGSRVNLTGQERNSTDLTTSKMRAEIRKNAYTFIKSLTNLSGIVINGVKYVYGNYTLENSISGYETLVIRNGNLTINGDVSRSDGKPLGIIILNDNSYNPRTDFSGSTAVGNIYIDRNVTSINAVIYADGGIISSNNGVPYVKDSVARTDDLMEPLTIKGSIFSRNTVGGAILYGTTYALPGGITIPESGTGSFDNAMIYDLNYLRRGWLCAENASDPTNLTNNGNCATGMPKTSTFKIEYDPKIQVQPPKLFYK